MWQAALRRHLAVEPLVVDAVVVDPEVVLHPLHLPHLAAGELLAGAAAALAERGGAAVDAVAAVALADGEVDAVVVGDERRLAPVRLDPPLLRGPVLRRPYARVGVHRLPRRERHAVAALVVAEHPDGRPVDVPPALIVTVIKLYAPTSFIVYVVMIEISFRNFGPPLASQYLGRNFRFFSFFLNCVKISENFGPKNMEILVLLK